MVLALHHWILSWMILGMVDYIGGQSVNQPKFCPLAAWNTSAVTLVDSTINRIFPNRIFIDINNAIYITASNLDRVPMWIEGSNVTRRNISNDLSQSQGLFVSSTGDVYIDNAASHGQVEKWTLNASSPIIAMYINESCISLFLGLNETLYCAVSNLHQVVTKSLNSVGNLTNQAAGNGTAGSTSELLHYPMGIFVTNTSQLYVADCGNSRIQLFESGQLVGTTVAGSAVSGTITLNCPSAVILDADGYLFIVDTNNHRIIGSSSLGYRCIAGCSSQGNQSTQMNYPASFSFDSKGNMFVVDNGNNRVQLFILATNSCGASYNQPQLCASATWNQYATTIVNSSWLLGAVQNLFVDTHNTLYVAAQYWQAVQVWPEGSLTPTRNISTGSNGPYAVFATTNGDIYVDNGATNQSVARWTVNGTGSTVAMYASDICWGLFVDIYGNIYCSIPSRAQVFKRAPYDDVNRTFAVAGNGGAGSAADMLNEPRGIFVDTDLTLYVADCVNNRIQTFRSGQLNGTTVTSNASLGNLTFNCPASVVLDGNGYFYFADSYNNRIIASGPNGFRCVAACTGGSGVAANQLNQARALSFDSFGNLFVVDLGNSRVQKFFLNSNSCNETTAALSTAPNLIDAEETSAGTEITTDVQTTPVTETSTGAATTIGTATATGSETTTGTKTTTGTEISTDTATASGTATATGTNTTAGTKTITGIETLTSTKTSIVTKTTTFYATVPPVSTPFLPPVCSNPATIGLHCNISNTACAALQPCVNNATCLSNSTSPASYVCSCAVGFDGVQCQFDRRPCQSSTCWNNGTCRETSASTFNCSCSPGWEGVHCETQVNLCKNVQCLNQGVCRPSFLNYTCQCLGESYYGVHCEKTASQTAVHQIVSKSFAYIAIIALVILALFIVIMDVMKYIFHIDPVSDELKRIQEKKLKVRKRPSPPFAIRYIYVHSSSPPGVTNHTPSTQQTSV